ncbi:hypothetical protein AAFF_G00391430 [Aldrovandia affinis]|uniref:Uncharacterized protein n=1 Tax=Aldrovandia affinis TaxID=143900 RepID=A0AAD7SE28_9TELE|nr:hypothetical protein AAFF_G00391430 [Aldrovandia affinis]
MERLNKQLEQHSPSLIRLAPSSRQTEVAKRRPLEVTVGQHDKERRSSAEEPSATGHSDQTAGISDPRASAMMIKQNNTMDGSVLGRRRACIASYIISRYGE